MSILHLALALSLMLPSCDSPHRRFERSLAAWEQGKLLYEAGDYPGAARLFARASRSDPGSVALPLWESSARARAGELEEALTVLDQAISEGRSDASTWYNRAALLTRLGRMEEASIALDRTLATRAELIAKAETDPDFEALRGLPDASRLFRLPELKALMRGEAGSILVGGEFELLLEMEGARSAEPSLEWVEPPAQAFRLIQISDQQVLGERVQQRRITWTLRALQEGEGSLGPWRLTLGSQQVELGAVDFQVLSPRKSTEAPLEKDLFMMEFPNLREIVGARGAPSAFRSGPYVVVLHERGDHVELDPGMIEGTGVGLELRASDRLQTRGTLYRASGDASAGRVRVLHAGKSVLEIEI